jgi:adenylate kinase
LISHHPAEAGVCDVCTGPLVARADDTPEAVSGRLRDYHAKTRPILDLFRRKELIVAADGTRSAGDVQQDIRRQLNLGLNA